MERLSNKDANTCWVCRPALDVWHGTPLSSRCERLNVWFDFDTRHSKHSLNCKPSYTLHASTVSQTDGTAHSTQGACESTYVQRSLRPCASLTHLPTQTSVSCAGPSEKQIILPRLTLGYSCCAREIALRSEKSPCRSKFVL